MSGCTLKTGSSLGQTGCRLLVSVVDVSCAATLSGVMLLVVLSMFLITIDLRASGDVKQQAQPVRLARGGC